METGATGMGGSGVNTKPGGRTPKGNGDAKVAERLPMVPVGSQGAERRKAMETRKSLFVINDLNNGEARGQNAERQWRRNLCKYVSFAEYPEARGQNAERQWRPTSRPYGLADSGTKPGGRTPKGNGDDGQPEAPRRGARPKPGGRTPKGNGDYARLKECVTKRRGSQGAERRKAMETQLRCLRQ